MNPITRYVYYRFVVCYCLQKGYMIHENCERDIQNQLDQNFAQFPANYEFGEDAWNKTVSIYSVLSTVPDNCKTMIDMMIKVTEADSAPNNKVTHEWSFKEALNRLCPLFPFCP